MRKSKQSKKNQYAIKQLRPEIKIIKYAKYYKNITPKYNLRNPRAITNIG